MKTGRVNLRLEPALIEELRDLALRNKLTMSEQVRQLILTELEKLEREKKKRADAEQA